MSQSAMSSIASASACASVTPPPAMTRSPRSRRSPSCMLSVPPVSRPMSLTAGEWFTFLLSVARVKVGALTSHPVRALTGSAPGRPVRLAVSARTDHES